ncbi:4'-phosphopantetheinyl transferase family protein [Pedobacter agri]|uniref:4'-phosphopantetheinyl transferase family protein n=1 Tax=Pedobacter agri TaxID=454586 RepID=UPI00292D07B6|nr:4'-phosphopantetheinyl transferase superfamily protein [Pedobacter agri]
MFVNHFLDLEWKLFNNQFKPDYNCDYIFKVTCHKFYDTIKYLYAQILSAEEIDRSKRFRQSADAKLYICSRYSLRKILSIFLGIHPQEIIFEFGWNKKPKVTGVEFNISHSGDLVLLAVSKTPIGVDLEQVSRPFSSDFISKNIFSTHELAVINHTILNSYLCYELWTRKEAILKATGEGLIDDLYEIDVLANKITRFDKTFKLFSFSVNEMYVACFASSSINQIKFFDYQ